MISSASATLIGNLLFAAFSSNFSIPVMIRSWGEVMPKATLSDGQYCHSPLSLITSLMQAMVARMMVVVMMTVVVNIICGKPEQKPYSHASADDKSYTLFPFLWYLQNRWHWQDESLDVNRTATASRDRTLNQFPDIWRNSAPCNLCEKEETRRDSANEMGCTFTS